MSYEKQTWQNGDIITAQKLNHIEDGIPNVEAIKIFTFNYLSIPANTIQGGGGGPFEGTPPAKFGDLIGDKTIIGFEATTVKGANNLEIPLTVFPMIAGKNPIINQNDSDVRNAQSITFSVLRAQTAEEISSQQVDIYAICI